MVLPISNRHCLFAISLLVFFVMVRAGVGESSPTAHCFQGMFIFGDSNSDTGGYWTALPPQPSPYGVTYFGKPSGRDSDGRVIVDFLAQALGLPFVSPYLKSVGADYTHGVNFAISKTKAFEPTSTAPGFQVNSISLGIQVEQFKVFKTQVEQFQRSGPIPKMLPSSSIFGNSLYVIYTAQNDITLKIIEVGGNQTALRSFFPQVVSAITASIKELYDLGARNILVFNVAPVGCHPSILTVVPHNSSDLDSFGCLKPFNNLISEFNDLLKNQVLNHTLIDLPGALLHYFDTYSALLDLYQHPQDHGFQFGTKACCGYGGGPYNFSLKGLCGSKLATACADPRNYVSWDGIHTTEAANNVVSNYIMAGSFMVPSVPLCLR